MFQLLGLGDSFSMLGVKNRQQGVPGTIFTAFETFQLPQGLQRKPGEGNGGMSGQLPSRQSRHCLFLVRSSLKSGQNVSGP